MPLTENTIEHFTIELLERAGYEYVYGPQIAPDGEHAERQSYHDVLLPLRLQAAIDRLNPGIPAEARFQAFRNNGQYRLARIDCQ